MRIRLKTALSILTVLVLFIAPMIVFAENEVEIHGFLAQGFMKSNENNYLVNSDEGSYQFNEFGLNFQYFYGDKLAMGAQLGARDLESIGNDDVGLNWVYGDYRWRDWLGFRAGIVKMPVALYNETRDIDALRTWILLPQSIYSEWTRDAAEGLKGITLYGSVNMASAGILKYTAITGDLQVDSDSGTAQTIINASPILTEVSELDFSRAYIGSLRWNAPLEGLLLGTDCVYFEKYQVYVPYSMVVPTGYPPPNDLAVYTTNVLALDMKNIVSLTYSLEYMIDNLILAAEMKTSEATIVGGGDQESENWYVSAAYRFLRWFEAGTYYSYSEKDKNGSGPENELKDICLSTRFDISSHMTFKFEMHFMDGLYTVYAGDDGTTDDSWMLYTAKVSYNF